MSGKKSKKRASSEAREADVFLRWSGDFLKWFQENLLLVCGVIAVVLVAGAGVVVYGEWVESKEKEAQKDFFAVERDYLKLKETTASTDKEPKKLDFEKDLQGLTTRFNTVVSQHAGLGASYLSAIQSANILSEHGKYNEAEKILRTAMQKPARSKLLQGLLGIMLGTVAEKSGNCEAAVVEWEKVLKQQTTEYLHSQAMLKKALCYEQLNKKADAMKIYQDIQTKFEKSEASRRARAYLRLLEVKKES